MNFEKWFKTKSADKPAEDPRLEEYLAKINNNGRFRVSLLNDQERRLIARQLAGGREPDLDEAIRLVGRERAREIHWRSVELNQADRKGRQEQRRQELISSGRDKEPLVLKEQAVNIADIHGRQDGLDNDDIINGLPAQLPGKIINVGYEEKASSNQDDDLEGKPLQFVDSSGRISAKFLQDFFGAHEESAFIMTGGNLRGCYLEALKGVMKEADRAKVKQVDFHVPLDKCYDDPVYGQLTGFKDLPEAVQAIVTHNAEIYQNGQLTAVGGHQAGLDARYRFYFWDKSDVMLEKMKQQLEKGITGPDAEAELNKLVARQEEEDQVRLARLRESLVMKKN